VSAATEDETSITVGDRVFVHPHDEQAPLHLRGLAGTVTGIRADQAQLQVHPIGEQVWVGVELLRPERRRRRQPVIWRFGPRSNVRPSDELPHAAILAAADPLTQQSTGDGSI
jgi:hypothetical protein